MYQYTTAYIIKSINEEIIKLIREVNKIFDRLHLGKQNCTVLPSKIN